jgi:hypothetical protein
MLPIVVEDKQDAAEELRAGGVDVLEFWNYGAHTTGLESDNTRFLRRHVLGLPIHQDLTARHMDYVAGQVLALLSGRAEALPYQSAEARRAEALPHQSAEARRAEALPYQSAEALRYQSAEALRDESAEALRYHNADNARLRH